jgi:hypothetical protein
MQTHTNREDLHRLLDRIPETDVTAARKILRALADPVGAALHNAPDDDEPLSAHERAAWDADQRRRATGESPVSHEDLLSELGVSEADLQ